MSAPISRVLLFCLILLSFSKHSVAAEEKVPACRGAYRAAHEALIQDLKKLEMFYVQYRWAETKIRLLTYENLWRARLDALDPLSGEMRTEGNKEEDRLLEILKSVDEDSKNNSNAFWGGIKSIGGYAKSFEDCCPERHYLDCIGRALKPLFDKVETGHALFDGIFERERDYRKEVELTVGSRKGVYPEDTIEPKAKHPDYYTRYELDRRVRRFQEDQEIAFFFQDLYKMLSDSFAGNDCCYSCGKTAWEIKSEKLFRES